MNRATSVDNPKNLDILRAAKNQKQLIGQAGLKDMPRISAEVEWKIQTWLVKNDPYMKIDAKCELKLTCQRCLEDIKQKIQINRVYRFVADEKLASELDIEAEEDILVVSEHFNLIDLIEDELVMAIPYAPMHEQCALPTQISHQQAEKVNLTSNKVEPETKADLWKELKYLWTKNDNQA